MLDEEMDDIIRNAASSHHPAYNDKAWEKMELQLDKHLPQKTDRRKFIFFLLFFLLLGGAAFLGVNRFMGNKDQGNTKIAETPKVDQPVSVTTITNPGSLNNDPQNISGNNIPEQVTGNPGNAVTGNILVPRNNNITTNAEKNKRSTVLNKGRSDMRIIAADPFADIVTNNGSKTNSKVPLTGNNVNKTGVVITAADPINGLDEKDPTVTVDLKKEKPAIEEQKKEAAKPNKEKEKATSLTTTNPSPEKKKTGKKFASNFGLTASVGPDLSFITLNKAGKITLTYGAGLSYQVSKRATVKAGFYVTKKIYTATPDQYHTPGGNYPNLQQVDANCKVYEIPVGLTYDIAQRKNHSWFGGIGLSSYLMKTENYYYDYKTPYGQSYNYEKEIQNENKHYFAVLTISGGYKYNINKRVSVQAEPYVKLPLAGIGLGKIKLNSSGILLTATIKPFAKRK